MIIDSHESFIEYQPKKTEVVRLRLCALESQNGSLVFFKDTDMTLPCGDKVYKDIFIIMNKGYEGYWCKFNGSIHKWETYSGASKFLKSRS